MVKVWKAFRRFRRRDKDEDESHQLLTNPSKSVVSLAVDMHRSKDKMQRLAESNASRMNAVEARDEFIPQRTSHILATKTSFENWLDGNDDMFISQVPSWTNSGVIVRTWSADSLGDNEQRDREANDLSPRDSDAQVEGDSLADILDSSEDHTPTMQQANPVNQNMPSYHDVVSGYTRRESVDIEEVVINHDQLDLGNDDSFRLSLENDSLRPSKSTGSSHDLSTTGSLDRILNQNTINSELMEEKFPVRVGPPDILGSDAGNDPAYKDAKTMLDNLQDSVSSFDEMNASDVDQKSSSSQSTEQKVQQIIRMFERGEKPKGYETFAAKRIHKGSKSLCAGEGRQEESFDQIDDVVRQWENRSLPPGFDQEQQIPRFPRDTSSLPAHSEGRAPANKHRDRVADRLPTISDDAHPIARVRKIRFRMAEV